MWIAINYSSSFSCYIDVPRRTFDFLLSYLGSKGFSDSFLARGLGVGGRIGVIPPVLVMPIILESGTSRVPVFLGIFLLLPGDGQSNLESTSLLTFLLILNV